EFYENPYPTYAALRKFAPVHRCPDGSYFLTRHADLDRIYRDRHHFSSDKKSAFGPKFGIASPLYEHHTTSLVFNDPPYHARVRRADRAPLRGWSLAILGALEAAPTAEQQAAGNRAVREFSDYLRILIADRRRHPGDDADILTRLLHDGELTEPELLHNCIFLL